jgi:hypothetical protein
MHNRILRPYSAAVDRSLPNPISCPAYLHGSDSDAARYEQNKFVPVAVQVNRRRPIRSIQSYFHFSGPITVPAQIQPRVRHLGSTNWAATTVAGDKRNRNAILVSQEAGARDMSSLSLTGYPLMLPTGGWPARAACCGAQPGLNVIPHFGAFHISTFPQSGLSKPSGNADMPAPPYRHS